MNVLVADDEPALRRLVTRVLAALGHACQAVACAEELELAARRERPDAVVSDVQLGGGDGVPVCLRLKAERPELKILMMTGDPEAALRAEAAGLGPVLAKPFKLEELERALEALGIVQA